VQVVPCGPGPRVDLGCALDDLLQREIVGLLVEGGATLAGALADAGWVDRVMRYVAPRVIGGDRAPGPLRGDGVERLADARVLAFRHVRRLGDDLLIEAVRPLEIPCLPD
jgi:diaminohydroxyphosphoribosylaminopyrimidine deaminase / 5-amino-6-(5-phosphoribosylamino)uracil reductase